LQGAAPGSRSCQGRQPFSKGIQQAAPGTFHHCAVQPHLSSDLEEALSSHISACLVKPVDMDELLFWLRSLGNDRGYAPGRGACTSLWKGFETICGLDQRPGAVAQKQLLSTWKTSAEDSWVLLSHLQGWGNNQKGGHPMSTKLPEEDHLKSGCQRDLKAGSRGKNLGDIKGTMVIDVAKCIGCHACNNCDWCERGQAPSRRGYRR